MRSESLHCVKLSEGPSDTPPRRPYLNTDARRRQLLDSATRLAGRSGLDGLTMVALAKEAGVSRQLVYEHFRDLPTLVAALVVDRFSDLDAMIAATLARSPANTDANAVRAVAGMLALPPVDRHIIRTLLAHASLPEHELGDLARELRARMITRWSTALQSTDSDALIWALIQAAFGLGDLLDADEITVEQALDHFSLLVHSAFPGS